MKFQVHVGEKFELILTTEKKQVPFLEKVFSRIVIFITIGVFSSAVYGAVSGDYLIFESILDTLYKIVKAVVEG